MTVPDSLLHDEFSKSLKIRENSRFFMSYALIPLEVAGSALVFISTLPTNLSDPYRKKAEFGNRNLATPGLLLMGAGLISCMMGITINMSFKDHLLQNIQHYNQVILKHH